jgi:rare lipoprotein A
MKTSANIYSRAALLGTALLMAVSVASCGGHAPVVSGEGRYLGTKVVSWYGPGFHGERTASGEWYDMESMTCAHKSFAFGTILKLVNPSTNQSVIVTVNDRGPFVEGRDIDLSRAAIRKLGLFDQGVGQVSAYVIGRDMRYAEYLKEGSLPSEGAMSLLSARRNLYSVQVGSFADVQAAGRLKSALRERHDRVYVATARVDGRRYFRVRVGKFSQESEARDYMRKLMGEGYTGISVVPFEM